MGVAIARRLGSGGAKVVANDLSPEAADKTVADLQERGHEAVAMAGDVSAIADVRRLVDATRELFGAIHVLVNNAGVLRPTRVVDIEGRVGLHHQGQPEGHLPLLPRRASRDAAAGLGPNRQTCLRPRAGAPAPWAAPTTPRPRRGCSLHAPPCARGRPRRHHGQRGVPRAHRHRTWAPDESTKEQMDAYAERFPAGRIGEPREVADVVALLASERTSYITGASLTSRGALMM